VHKLGVRQASRNVLDAFQTPLASSAPNHSKEIAIVACVHLATQQRVPVSFENGSGPPTRLRQCRNVAQAQVPLGNQSSQHVSVSKHHLNRVVSVANDRHRSTLGLSCSFARHHGHCTPLSFEKFSTAGENFAAAEKKTTRKERGCAATMKNE
jgi:hypothetical protein